MSDSQANRLLGAAATERTQLRRHLLVAAAIREVIPVAIVVGGTAEEYWTARTYHETDLDICAPLAGTGASALRRLGFKPEGRHWFHASAQVAVEFPDSTIDGDPNRAAAVPVGGGTAMVISVEDLYIDRLRRTTVAPGREDVQFDSALAVAAGAFDQIEWPYVQRRLTEIARSDAPVAASMRRTNTVIRRRVRREST